MKKNSSTGHLEEENKKDSLEDALVCYCFQVSREEILQVIQKYGLKTVDEVAQYSDACNGCRTCYIDIEKILAHYWGKHPSS